MDITTTTAGFMAVFAVSGSVVFLSMHAHNRLLSHFFAQIDQNRSSKHMKPKKKVRFAGDVSAPPAPASELIEERLMEGMPQNWQVMYKGILQDRFRHRIL